MPEAIKFRPENTHANDFMRPPTEPLRLPVSVHTLLQEDAIKEAAVDIVSPSGIRKGCRPVLRIGSELEFLLFADDSVPHKDIKKRGANPNYSARHRKHVDWLVDRMRSRPEQGGLSDALYDEGNVKRIFMEIRTSPLDASGYMSAMDRVRQWFQENSPAFDVRPVIWSQHLHLSLTDSVTGLNLLQDDDVRDTVAKGIIDIYHRALPLLRLPENVEDKDVRRMGEYYGVNEKGGFGNDPVRLEGRMTNSDYAFDPYINLLFHLIGVKRGLHHIGDHTKIDEDYPLKNTNHAGTSYFMIGEGYTAFDHSLDHMLSDMVLQEELPLELLTGFHDMAQPYWDISTGAMNVRTGRERAYDIALGESPVITDLSKSFPNNALFF